MSLVERAKAALQGTTAGPWIVNREGWACISSGSDSVIHGYFEGDCPDCGDRIIDNAMVAVSIEDATFIAEVRTLVPELVAEVERLQAIIAGSPEALAAATQSDRTMCVCGHPRSEHGDGVVHTACCVEVRSEATFGFTTGCLCGEFEAAS